MTEELWCELSSVYLSGFKVKGEIHQLLLLRCVDKREIVVLRQIYTSYRVHRETHSQGALGCVSPNSCKAAPTPSEKAADHRQEGGV